MLFGSHRTESLLDELDSHGYRRLLDLPGMPVANACGLRYDTVVPIVPGPTDWYLRSFGVRFDLANRRWRRQSARWYSVGWGLVGGVEVDELLLIQAWPPMGAELMGAGSVLGRVRRSAVRYRQDIDDAGCLRVAAVLDGRGGSGVG